MVASAGSGDLAEVLGEMYTGPNITVILDAEDAMSRFIHDISRAMHKIAISIPDGRPVDPFQEQTLASLREAKARGVDIVMKCRNWKDLPEDWKGLAIRRCGQPALSSSTRKPPGTACPFRKGGS